MMSAKLHLFGQFSWELSSGQSVPKLRDKTAALIAYIALSGKGIIRRQVAADLLWANGKDPFASVRQAVREIKDMEHSFGSDLFQADAQYLSLNLKKLWVDARIATQCSNEFNAPIAEQLLSCELGPLLQDNIVDAEVFCDWLTFEGFKRNEDLESSLVQLLDQLSAGDSKISEIQRVSQAILKFDSTNERAYRAQMNAFLKEGDRASALRQFDICKEILRRELDVEPSEATFALAEQIKGNSHKSLTASFQPAASFQIIGDSIVKPTIYVENFNTKSDDPVIDFVAQTFRSDICEQLACNDRFSVRSGEVELISDLADSGGGKLLNSEATYKIRGNIISVEGHTTVLVQMFDGSSGDILWMKRVKPEMKELLAGNDEQAILAAIEMYRKIELAETDKSHRLEDGMLNARQCVLRAISIMFRFSEDAVTEAKRYLQRALTQAPGYSEAMAWLAFLHSIELGQGFTSDPQATRDKVGLLIRQAIELSPSSDIGLAIAGHLEAFVYHDFETALEYFDRSLAANPNCSYAFGFSAITHCYIGKPDEALQMLGRCRQIMPFDAHPYYFDTARCIASMLSGRYEDAVRIGRQVLRNNPHFHANYRPLLSSLGHLGRIEEAEPVHQEFKKFQPDFSVDWHLNNYPPLEEDITETYVNGLRLAGVLEK
ncbi:MAG: BTAD domain-containing putative transcriptional regulator [Sneathiella sp.]